MLIRDEEEIHNAATWKKIGLSVLIASEIGLAPFLAEAVGETNNIIYQLITSHAAPDLMNSIIGYGFSIPYVTAAMLSVGDLNKTLQRLTSPSTRQGINPILKTIQSLIVGLGFIVGSGAAAAGILGRWGKTPLLYSLALYTMGGQICVVILQANKRIEQSAHAMEAFLRSSNKKGLLKALFHKPVAKAAVNTLFNSFYWGAFYYYLGANVSYIFDLSNLIQKILSPTFGFLGAYMAFSTQGIDEIKQAHTAITPERPAQKLESSKIGTTLTALSFACRVLATASFSYSVISGDTESSENFDRTIAAVAIALMLPGAASALQYARYIHAQVNEAVVSIPGLFRCRRYSFWSQTFKEEKNIDNMVRDCSTNYTNGP